MPLIILIIHAHLELRSFNGALKGRAVEVLSTQGHKVQVSDRYAMGWKPHLDGTDITTPRVDAGYLNLPAEQENMFAHGCPRCDVEQEQAKILCCDVLIFQFPICWFSMPAILKGWDDRTMTRGLAYASEGERKAYLEGYGQVLGDIDTAVPLFFHSREDYGDDQRLKPSVVARSGFQWNPRAGQNHDRTRCAPLSVS